MKILIVAGLPDFIPNESFDKYIGVDRGSSVDGRAVS